MIATALDRVRRVLLTGLAFLGFFLGGTVLSYVVLPVLHAWPGPVHVRSRRCRQVVGRSWVLFHDYMRLAGILRYDPRRTRLALPDGPFVLVANHPTLVDVTALVATFPDVAIVAKAAMYRSPLVGRLLRYCDHICREEGLFGGVAVMDAALARLASGTPVLIFPEGTRSPRRSLGTIHPGAFEIAARAGVPVVAALLRCEPPTLMRGDPWYAIPEAPAVLTVEHLATENVAVGEAEAVARRLQSRYAERLRVPAAEVAAPSPVVRNAEI